MKKAMLQILSLAFIIAVTASCRNDSIGHIGATKLVIMQPIPVTDNRFDENFRAVLDLLMPHRCHDTAFIQDQIFLERIDLEMPYRREFAIPPKLWRDFFGSNNPDKTKALREDMLYFHDTCFEKNTDKQFLTESLTGSTGYADIICRYLSRNRKNSLVYLVSADTMRKTFHAGNFSGEVNSDLARLNCRIVGDLRNKPAEELAGLNVILILIPPEANDTLQHQVSVEKTAVRHAAAPPPVQAIATKKPVIAGIPGKNARCAPDSVISRINSERNAIINEFRNLLHYIATTTDDDLTRKYRADADREIRRIPGVRIEGIAGNLGDFLNSGFSKQVKVLPLTDHCNMITGIRITGH